MGSFHYLSYSTMQASSVSVHAKEFQFIIHCRVIILMQRDMNVHAIFKTNSHPNAIILHSGQTTKNRRINLLLPNSMLLWFTQQSQQIQILVFVPPHRILVKEYLQFTYLRLLLPKTTSNSTWIGLKDLSFSCLL